MNLFTSGYSLLVSALVVAAPLAPAEVSSRIDATIENRCQEMNLSLEGPADDATFLRRVWLDLAGRVPPALKAREFLEDRDPAKRSRLVDALLASDEFADHWGRVWTQTLTGKRPIRQEKYDGRVLHEYLRDSFQANKPYRQIVSELIRGEGLSDASGPANFLLRYEAKPADLAGAVGKQFLGVSLQCAQCHDHPMAKWKQDDFWGVAAFFSRVRMLESNDDNNQYVTAVLETRRGELMLPDPKGKPDENGQIPKKKVLPRLPIPSSTAVNGNRRQTLAAWVTAEDNPYFAKHAVNRVWAQLFGEALQEPLDSLRDPNSSQHPQLLNLLAADFISSGTDLKRLVRIILLSRTYQRGTGVDQITVASPSPTAELQHQRMKAYARFPVRPLSVDQLYHSIVQATGHRGEEEPNAQESADNDDEGYDDKPIELLRERAFSMQRSLALLNGEYIHQAVKQGAKTTRTVNGARLGPGHIEWLFLATLSRRPTNEEAMTLMKLVRAGKNTNEGLADALWVLLNSAEFNSNH